MFNRNCNNQYSSNCQSMQFDNQYSSDCQCNHYQCDNQFNSCNGCMNQNFEFSSPQPIVADKKVCVTQRITPVAQPVICPIECRTINRPLLYPVYYPQYVHTVCNQPF